MRYAAKISRQRVRPVGVHHSGSYMAQAGRTKVYVSVYAVSRCYGGPEEGGWYYDWYEHVKTYPRRVRRCRVPRIVEEMMNKHGWVSKYNRSSVLGGADCVITVEDWPGESATRRRPHYE
jgi:hypothetical protein